MCEQFTTHCVVNWNGCIIGVKIDPYYRGILHRKIWVIYIILPWGQTPWQNFRPATKWSDLSTLYLRYFSWDKMPIQKRLEVKNFGLQFCNQFDTHCVSKLRERCCRRQFRCRKFCAICRVILGSSKSYLHYFAMGSDPMAKILLIQGKGYGII